MKVLQLPLYIKDHLLFHDKKRSGYTYLFVRFNFYSKVNKDKRIFWRAKILLGEAPPSHSLGFEYKIYQIKLFKAESFDIYGNPLKDKFCYELVTLKDQYVASNRFENLDFNIIKNGLIRLNKTLDLTYFTLICSNCIDELKLTHEEEAAIVMNSL